MAEKSVEAIPPNTCKYQCRSGSWQLVSGNASPGYYCPQSIGNCTGSSEGNFHTVNAYPDVPDDLKSGATDNA